MEIYPPENNVQESLKQIRERVAEELIRTPKPQLGLETFTNALLWVFLSLTLIVMIGKLPRNTRNLVCFVGLRELLIGISMLALCLALSVLSDRSVKAATYSTFVLMIFVLQLVFGALLLYKPIPSKHNKSRRPERSSFRMELAKFRQRDFLFSFQAEESCLL